MDKQGATRQDEGCANRPEVREYLEDMYDQAFNEGLETAATICEAMEFAQWQIARNPTQPTFVARITNEIRRRTRAVRP